MKNYQDVARELIVVERAAWWNPRVRRILKTAPLVVLFLLLNTRAARAACSFHPTPDPTADGSSNSLRHAVQMANASGQDCLIQLQAGTYTLTITNPQWHVTDSSSGSLDITDSGHTVTVQGQGTGVSIVNANGIDRVFEVLSGANAVFSKLTIEGGVARDDGTAGALPGTTESEGGGLLVQDGGHVSLSQVWVEGNQAIGGKGRDGTKATPSGGSGQVAAGGGLFLSAGAITLTDSQVSGNAVIGGRGGNGMCHRVTARTGPGYGGSGGSGGTGFGGGLYVASGTINSTKSTISGNAATGGVGGNGASASCNTSMRAVFGGGGGNAGTGFGGGLYVASGTINSTKSTISGNTAMGGVGGDGNSGHTFGGYGGNAGTGAGGGIYIAGPFFFSLGGAKLLGSTVSGNTATGGNGGNGGAAFCRCVVDSAITPCSHCDGLGGPGGFSQGGGIFVANGAISLVNSTLSNNTASMGGAAGGHASTDDGLYIPGGDSAGGGLFVSDGSVNLLGVTIASNHAEAGGVGGASYPLGPILGASLGGGIAAASATSIGNSLTTNTTLIGDNTRDSGSPGEGPDVAGAITASYSLISQTAGATITDDGHNIFDVIPVLDPNGLGSNGGATQTVALEDGSPAIDAGDNAICRMSPPMGLGGIDQRGFTRFRHGDSLCDIGAFEFIDLLVQPASESFGREPVGHQSPYRTISVTNNQMATVTLSAALGGADPADFIEQDTCGTSLAPNTNCTISIAFHPAAAGARTALLTVSDSPDRTSPYTVKLDGVGG